MTDFARLNLLSGKNPNQPLVDKLVAEQKAINESYDAAIAAAKVGRQINEGLFDNLKAALQTASSIGKKGASAVADKAKKIGSQIKNLYLDKKAQLELTKMVIGLKKAVDQFAKIEDGAPTIMERDPEVKRAVEIFKDLFSKTIEVLQSRQAVTEGINLGDLAALQTMMTEVKESMTEVKESTEETTEQ